MPDRSGPAASAPWPNIVGLKDALLHLHSVTSHARLRARKRDDGSFEFRAEDVERMDVALAIVTREWTTNA